jgi:YD repeat-containing protein
LSFDRYFLSGPSYRARLGSLGSGWTHSYEITLQKRSDASVVINGPSGFDRIFEADGQGGYKAGAGDYGRLTSLPDSEFVLVEQNGFQTHFRSDGRFDFIEDTNGNRIQIGYDAQRNVTSATEVFAGAATGRTLAFSYTTVRSEPRLARVIGSLGLEIAYEYDEWGNLVESARGGRVERYEYSIDNPLDRHNLVAYTDPNGHVSDTSTSGTRRSRGRHPILWPQRKGSSSG